MYLHFNFSSGSCNDGVFAILWWWWCWLAASCCALWCKWFRLLLPTDIKPVIADDTLTADATESCILWWLCKWSVAVPLLPPAATKSGRHRPCASLILCMPRSIAVWLLSLFLSLSLSLSHAFSSCSISMCEYVCLFLP